MVKTLMQKWGLPAELAEIIHTLVREERKHIYQRFKSCHEQVRRGASVTRWSNDTTDCLPIPPCSKVETDWWLSHYPDEVDGVVYQEVQYITVDLLPLSPYERKAIDNWVTEHNLDGYEIMEHPYREKDAFTMQVIRETGNFELEYI